jgi:hypothetical protein
MITGQPSSPTWSPGLGGEPTTVASHNTLSQGKKRFAITTFVGFLKFKGENKSPVEKAYQPLWLKSVC